MFSVRTEKVCGAISGAFGPIVTGLTVSGFNTLNADLLYDVSDLSDSEACLVW